MSKMVQLKMTKAVLYLTEAEIYQNLPPDLIVTAIKRGKWERRIARSRKTDIELAEKMELKAMRARGEPPW